MTADITNSAIQVPITGGVSAVYPAAGNGGSQLCYKNALNTDVQLTSVKASIPTVSGNGVTFLPGTTADGGLLLQWGFGSSGVPITFPVPFTNAIFSPRVTLTPFGTTAQCTTPPVMTTTPTTTGFQVANNGGQVFSFHWMAIGQA